MHPNPLVSVITPTWNRPRSIRRCIESVWAQTYRPIEHIIVIDGPNPGLRKVLRRAGYLTTSTVRRQVSLGRNWTDYSGNFSIGAAARLVGQYLAGGEYIAYLDDDDQWLPHHLDNMVAALDDGADLVCCRWLHGPNRGVMGATSDNNPAPHVGTVSGSMIAHRASLLRHSGWGFEGYEGDGRMVERWIDAGYRCTVLDEPTVIFPGWAKGKPDNEEGVS
jgi:glycosyltransferase involved in cell wall biosynthesis